MTAFVGFICIHGFKKRTKNIPIKCFTNIGETGAKFFITFVICLVETKAAESPHTYYSTYEKKVLSVGKKVIRNSQYLYRGDMFALYEDDDVRAICVITQEQAGKFELKNIVTVPKYQRKGYGQKLIAFIVDYYNKSGSELYVGTGDSPTILCFYEKCGFVKSHVVKKFL